MENNNNSKKSPSPNTKRITGMQVLKQLPNSDCRECGFPRCLVFSMKVVTGKADILDCPYAPADLIKQIGPADPIDKRDWYEKLIGLTVDIKKIKQSDQWEHLHENIYWSQYDSWAGCNMHPVRIFIFIDILGNTIQKITFNLLNTEDNKDSIESLYSYSSHPTTDLKKSIRLLLEEIALSNGI